MDPQLIEGNLHVDQRGIVSFVNEFDFKGVVRFYTIRSHAPGESRGWIGHRIENKWFMALSGSIHVSVVAPNDWEDPDDDLPVQRFVLSALKPSVLCVPAGHATASIMLSSDAHLGVFSSECLENSRKDDWRFDIKTWPVTIF
jgi:dTDP-4-dehydrorhamnose 3,5-epimerase